ncbi:related to Dik6, novel virulence factor [Ustilago trichophora]|uniref:Related to Dik6, novel virulence factor n=1 Tax=Ustilago trichophora TaxID=86804 RepID=A0A5C3EEZ8_9BASI|nr:related to Dik6, novel virulence factor [Ustilago trichophora]
MSADTMSDLDGPGKPLSLLHPVDPSSMLFLHRNQTQSELVHALYIVMYAPTSRTLRNWLLASEFEVILTFLVCTIMLVKKKTLGKLWIFTRRRTLYGTFYVSNAVFVLVLGVAAYLVAWDLTAMIIASFSFAKVSTMEWWWIIPLPWWPLVVGAYVSIHGFAVGCSPRSPLSSFNAQATATHSNHRWIYLPVPRSSSLVNATLIVPNVLFSISTLALTSMSGHSYYVAKAAAKRLLPEDILAHVRDAKNHGSVVAFPGDQLPASDELIRTARNVAALYSETHRYVCINLAIFAACAVALFIPCVVYGLPNIVSLVDHACSRHPEPLPPSCNSFFKKLYFLLTEGKPRTEASAGHLDISTWKMTILAVIYISILVVCVPAFGWLPMYIICASFPSRVSAGDFRNQISNAVLAVSVITILSCSFVAIFCTVATLDPLFRAAIGLNIIRNQIPIDITVQHHRSMVEETHPSPAYVITNTNNNGEAQLEMHKLEGYHRTIELKSSSTTLKSNAKSPLEEFPDYPVHHHEIHVSTDVEAQRDSMGSEGEKDDRGRAKVAFERGS